MGNARQVQGRGPRHFGGDFVASTTRSEKMIQVTWTTVRQYTAEISATAWDRYDGAEGDTSGPLDAILAELEGDPIEQAVIERGIDSHQDAQ